MSAEPAARPADDAAAASDAAASDAARELAERAEQALEGRVRQVVEAHGGGITLDVTGPGEVRVNFQGRCQACPSAAITMGSLVRPALLEVEGVSSVTRRGATSRFAEERIARMFAITPRDAVAS
ncbi:MAG TPA: NifU family protein [Trebonia sp.]|nr:NifU family protein [Trebonia sp.]